MWCVCGVDSVIGTGYFLSWCVLRVLTRNALCREADGILNWCFFEV
jgi:hypothetical protein